LYACYGNPEMHADGMNPPIGIGNLSYLWRSRVMKAVVRYRGLLTVLTVVVSLGLAGVTPAVAQTEGIVDCVSTVWQLTAGQTIPVGAVVVRNDRDNIYVTYNLSDEKVPNACFGTLHL
jgi:hypothetical protein